MGRRRLWDRPSFPGAEAASGGSCGNTCTRVVSGGRGQVAVAWGYGR